MVETDFDIGSQSFSQAKRVGAEKCFQVALDRAKRGEMEMGKVFFRMGKELLDALDDCDVQADKCFSFSGIDDIKFKSFDDFLRWKNIPIVENGCSNAKGKQFGTSKKGVNVDCGERHNKETGEHPRNKFVEFSYVDPGVSCTETLGSSPLECEQDNDGWNRLRSDLPRSEVEEVDGTEEAQPADSFLVTLSQTTIRMKNTVVCCAFTFWLFCQAFMKRTKEFCAEFPGKLSAFTKRAKEWCAELPGKSYAFMNSAIAILLFVVLFVLVAAFRIGWFIIKTLFTIFMILLVNGLQLLAAFLSSGSAGGNSDRPQGTSRNQRKPCTTPKELPATSKEACRHLLACENANDPYKTLLVNEDASQEDIKRNYKKLALLVHPDRYTSDVVKADRAMKVLNAAYEILGDQDKREKHRQDQQQQESSRFSEDLNDFMASLKNLLQCDVCGGLHAVTQTDRDPLAGRYCGECRDYHRASPGEVWVENILWMKELYFCRKDDGSKGASKIYKYKSWGPCQTERFGHIPANSHRVFVKMKTTSSSNHANQQSQSNHTSETRHRSTSGKKNRRRKYKK